MNERGSHLPAKTSLAWLFDARCDGGTNNFEIRVHKDFTEAEAAREAQKYGKAIGRLPKVLRSGTGKAVGVRIVAIHKGHSRSPWSAIRWVGKFLIYTESSLSGTYHEEALFHEAAHVSLDDQVMPDAKWLVAQKADGKYISTYAKNHPTREDVAESFLAYFSARYVPSRISQSWKTTILETIPNRIAYFDALLSADDMKPFTKAAVQAPTPSPEITISGGSPVTEGGDISFTLTATPAPASDIQISVTVSETGSVAASGATGTRTVTVGAGGTVDFTVATEDDATNEADGSIKAAVTAGTGYTIGSAATASVAVSDNDTPEVDIAASSGATEGGDASFTLTAMPAPAADLAVSVTVTATGDYGVTTGARTVTIPTSGSATLTVATTDDSADEPNGLVTAALNAGDGYTVGARSSRTADILDDDEPAPPQPTPGYAPSAELVAAVRGYAAQTDKRQTYVDRWLRVLAAFGDDNGHAPMTAVEAQAFADRGWSRWDPVVAALTELEAAQTTEPATEPETQPEPEPAACVSPELQASVKGYSVEAWEGEAHVERWLRVLQTFSGTASEGSKMSSAEARDYRDRGWDRWIPVVEALQCLEERS
ncbi:MAG: hypothetical protein OXE48_07245 [Gammaproteobacteria bacterium]|nr:hypothetical protein [Gammaproteobacteria bacterium]